MIVLYIVALLLALMGIVIIAGKGDNLIAGYNTASKEERGLFGYRRRDLHNCGNISQHLGKETLTLALSASHS